MRRFLFYIIAADGGNRHRLLAKPDPQTPASRRTRDSDSVSTTVPDSSRPSGIDLQRDAVPRPGLCHRRLHTRRHHPDTTLQNQPQQGRHRIHGDVQCQRLAGAQRSRKGVPIWRRNRRIPGFQGELRKNRDGPRFEHRPRHGYAGFRRRTDGHSGVQDKSGEYESKP